MYQTYRRDVDYLQPVVSSSPQEEVMKRPLPLALRVCLTTKRGALGAPRSISIAFGRQGLSVTAGVSL
jgi:hypothetical protein